MFYIYIIYSNTAEKFYVGHSENPWDRLVQHNENEGDKYTGKYQNWELKAVFQVSENRGDALLIEKFIKRQKSKKLLLKLIEPEFIPTGDLAQLVRVPYVRD
jgi:putative endonuclease